MDNTITVRNLVIGAGQPKKVVPIVGKNRVAILESANEIARMAIHMVEWRADFYEGVHDTASVVAILQELREILSEVPILFTFRTPGEGGKQPISGEGYRALNLAIAASGLADLIDIEVFLNEQVHEIIAGIHAAGALVVASNHDFAQTPCTEELVWRLRKMQAVGGDILKIAVMPNTLPDVLRLLAATHAMVTQYAQKPVVTMAMSAKGVISRLSGEVFGSALTFGSVGEVSAPGQIPVDQLATVLEIIHRSLD